MKNPIKQAFDAIKDIIKPSTELIVDGVKQILPEDKKNEDEVIPDVLYEIDSVVDGQLVKLLGVITDEFVEGAKLVKIPDASGALVHKYFKAK